MERTLFRTPLGWAGIASSDRGIITVVLPKKERKTVERELRKVARTEQKTADRPPSLPLLKEAGDLLKKYFAGTRVSFDLPLDLHYYTHFQRAVWRAAAGIPWGETRSYAWIAKRIKNPRAARAVGRALGANPVPVFIP